LSLAFPLFTGAIIEYLQGSVFQPRSAEWLDFFSDTMGVVIGFLLMSALIHFLKKIKKIIRKDG
jgi:VanZ family protein